MNKLESILKNVDLFKDLDEVELIQLADIASFKSFKKGQHLFYQGDEMRNVYLLQNGRVKIYKNDPLGREQIVSIMSINELFPHVGFYRDGDYPAHAQTMEDVRLVVIPKQSFDRLLSQNPMINSKMFKLLGEKIIDLQNRLEEQILNNSYQQVIKLLLRMAKTNGVTQSDGRVLLRINLTIQDLGKMIGATRETMSRTLSKLKKQSLLEETAPHTYVFNEKKLIEELLFETE